MDKKDRPVYIISVAAELVDMHPQTLRLYERKGLIQPKRSGGKTRLYSERDVEKLREIRRLTQELGVNLAGVEEIMKLREELWTLEQRFREEAERLKVELGEKLEALKTPPALPAPGEGKKKINEKERPVYIISVAAELVGMHPQTLRLYEREGLVAPSRTSGKTRLYSERDVEKLKEIRRLTQELGVNLAGVEEIIRLRDELDIQQNRLESEIARLRLALLRELKPQNSEQKKTKTTAS
ncbi:MULTISPECIES: heat shock protein transcriptional repressor HspR, fused homodimer type [Meiothermus]|uniref:MerR family transcriptional regulator n=2 Tax=Meiothermus hypogaeus TaxID=884155 RepID=A0A511R533_9DEIN|nr:MULTISPECIES: helix-turn-helix transcriptional regulator [Meiothermus]RIH79358.1 putative heat shock protein HspR [Meiothermus hypogaeus]GEM84720.1 MerR family transcriptional regulator [Meiothermus hypogaeus NBRC 106114]GIW35026.1 MAG: MerR family transcriptional regulator [Meiothermus sp.]GIW38351.1 MAG: MerR family transcriptional regulator [Meiothermus sp.]